MRQKSSGTLWDRNENNYLNDYDPSLIVLEVNQFSRKEIQKRKKKKTKKAITILLCYFN